MHSNTENVSNCNTKVSLQNQSIAQFAAMLSGTADEANKIWAHKGKITLVSPHSGEDHSIWVELFRNLQIHQARLSYSLWE